ncbi:hypothetical protein Bbelb_133330 [Branchiostoma belcheri]|nr:hypothetical protein Bbelb_133330 [Branchiostoma belcheri]
MKKSHETDGLILLANVSHKPRPTAHPNFAKNLHTAADQVDELFITTQSCVSTLLAELGACPALKADGGDTCGGELSIRMNQHCLVNDFRDKISGGSGEEQMAAELRRLSRDRFLQVLQEGGFAQISIPDGHLLGAKAGQCRRL